MAKSTTSVAKTTAAAAKAKALTADLLPEPEIISGKMVGFIKNTAKGRTHQWALLDNGVRIYINPFSNLGPDLEKLKGEVVQVFHRVEMTTIKSGDRAGESIANHYYDLIHTAADPVRTVETSTVAER